METWMCGECEEEACGVEEWMQLGFIWLGPYDNLWACCGTCKTAFNLDGTRRKQLN
jgi:hypothetical protein